MVLSVLLGWRNLALYGVLIGVGQFVLLYLSINGHISPGIASLVVQTQVFFRFCRDSGVWPKEVGFPVR